LGASANICSIFMANLLVPMNRPVMCHRVVAKGNRESCVRIATIL